MKSKIQVNRKNKLNMMSKNLILILALAFTTTVSFGQGLFDKYEDIEGVTSGVINQKMFSMLASIDLNMDDKDAQQKKDAIKKIESIKLLMTGDEKISTAMSADIKRYVASSSLEELMRFKDGEQTVKFYVKEGKDENHVRELLMFINGLKEMTKEQNIEINGKQRQVETVVVSITGDVDLREISKITSGLNIPGGKQLEKASKKN